MKSKYDSPPGTDSAAEDLLEQLVYDFESSWLENQNAKICDFLPQRDHPRYQEILVELIRSDMELSQGTSERRPASDYFQQFVGSGLDEAARKAIVFEEYRQAVSRGDTRSLQTLGNQYDLDFSGFATVGREAAQIKFPEPGEMVGDFKLIGLLGEGAYGRVFLAQQQQLEDRLVVLKFTVQSTIEHRLLARMQHTNIMPIHSVHNVDDLCAICMPLLGIITLRDLYKSVQSENSGQLDRASIQTAVRYKEETVVNSIADRKNASKFRTRQNFERVDPRHIQRNFAQRDNTIGVAQKIAEGLSYAHQRGIVHGDLKPENILISDDGEPVILDFHLGRVTDENIGNLIGGTIPYMPPEQLRNFENDFSQPTPGYDVYACGIIIHELLTGKLPFAQVVENSSDFSEIASAKANQFRVADDSTVNLELDLVAIIEKCLAPEPSDRFTDGIELASELQNCLRYRPLQLANRGGVSNRIKKWSKRHPTISSASMVSTVAACLIGLLICGILVLNSRLATIAARTDSQNRIDAASKLQPALVAAFAGQMDKSTFADSIDTAKSLIDDNHWRNLSAIDENILQKLSPSQLQQEKLSAAETHFWLAELYHHTPPSSDEFAELNNQELALKHNSIGRAIWPDNRSKLALQTQWMRLDADAVAAAGEQSQPDNFEDRLLSTFLMDVPLKSKQLRYEKLAKEKSEHFSAWLLLANACSDQGNSAQAMAYYNVCQSIDPDSHVPWLLHGIECLRLNQNDAAIESLIKAESLAPDDVTVLLNLGLALGKNRQLPQALIKYDRAIELGVCQTRAYFLRSRLKRALGDSAGAKADYQHFMDSPPLDELSCITRGVRLQKSDPQLAIEDYQLALEFNPNSTTALNNLAHVHSEILQNNKAALEFMDRAIAGDGSSALLFASRAVLHARIGNERQAIKDVDRAVELQQSADIYYRVAGVYAQLSKLDAKHRQAALNFITKAAFVAPAVVLKLRSNDPDIFPIVEDNRYKAVFSVLSKLDELLQGD